MARTHGKNVNYSFNGVAVEDELRGVTQDISVPEAEITSFNDAWGNFLAGKPSISTSIDGFYSSASGDLIRTLEAAVGGGPVTTVFDLTGSGPASGNPEYTCTSSGLTGVLITDYSIELPANGAATVTASFQHSGTTTRAVS